MAGGGMGCDSERVCLSVYGRSVRLLESHALLRPRLRQAFNSLPPFFHLSLTKAE